ncbi:MAG TPA: hypothetical protein VNK43_07315 [Gemmatimonadales bacterium]|nr:hypothetical protein [Gemmatimonadales bacterium]
MRGLRADHERGVALILTLLLALVVAGIAIGVVVMTSSGTIIARFHATEAMMTAAADAGLERARDTLNGGVALPTAPGSFVTLEQNATVRDAYGNPIPGFTRSLYAGATGSRTGQYGIFASAISVIENARGAVVVRRIELKQDPFSRFARFFNTWDPNVMWGRNEVIFGPVHSNQGMVVQTGSPGATFWGPVSVVASSVTNQGSANWMGGLTTRAPVIPFPTTQTLQNLQSYAATGNTVVAGDPATTTTTPHTRIEFVAVDLNNDGDVTDDDEGFFRVYRASTPVTAAKRNYVNARRWMTMPAGVPGSVNSSTDPNLISPNCGGTHGGDWWTADSIYARHPGAAASKANVVQQALGSPSAGGPPGIGARRRCFPGGDRRLYPDSLHRVADAYGAWQAWSGWGGGPPAALVNAIALQGVAASGPYATTADAVARTFWPLSRALNPNFKGVIYVDGSLGLSGQVRGRVTLVATGTIMLVDDVTYVSTPGANGCRDILGLLTAEDLIIADNNVNTPFRVRNDWVVQFDESTNETIHGFVLTLGNLGGENISPSAAEPQQAPEACAGGSRGCKVLVGGTIQQSVAATYSSRGGWAEQDTYDRCGVDDPPPYYPTTGRFSKNRYYEIDPVGFDVNAWFLANQP